RREPEKPRSTGSPSVPPLRITEKPGMLLRKSAPSWAGTGWRGAFGSVRTTRGSSAAGAVTTTGVSARTGWDSAARGRPSVIRATGIPATHKVSFFIRVSIGEKAERHPGPPTADAAGRGGPETRECPHAAPSACVHLAACMLLGFVRRGIVLKGLPRVPPHPPEGAVLPWGGPAAKNQGFSRNETGGSARAAIPRCRRSARRRELRRTQPRAGPRARPARGCRPGRPPEGRDGWRTAGNGRCAACAACPNRPD